VTKDGKLESDEISVVFCVDISGSMSMGKPTRLSCVKEAMINQINHMHDNNNKRKIGVVTFEE
jgi:Mg-chelatase subunit ChlD